jgi:hypothetical protein
MAFNLEFLDRSRYFFTHSAPQLFQRGWMDPVPDSPLLRKLNSAGNRSQDLWICDQELRPSAEKNKRDNSSNRFGHFLIYSNLLFWLISVTEATCYFEVSLFTITGRLIEWATDFSSFKEMQQSRGHLCSSEDGNIFPFRNVVFYTCRLTACGRYLGTQGFYMCLSVLELV